MQYVSKDKPQGRFGKPRGRSQIFSLSVYRYQRLCVFKFKVHHLINNSPVYVITRSMPYPSVLCVCVSLQVINPFPALSSSCHYSLIPPLYSTLHASKSNEMKTHSSSNLPPTSPVSHPFSLSHVLKCSTPIPSSCSCQRGKVQNCQPVTRKYHALIH